MTKYCQNFCEKSINSFYNCQPRPTSASALGSIKKTLSESRKSFGNFASSLPIVVINFPNLIKYTLRLKLKYYLK